MGGKQKQAQRTKGNVRPSSSARAAEMLAASGSMSAGFVGFGALSGDLGYVPTTQGIEEADATVDSDFRMLLRKLSKRDAITKLKTLQEVTALCKQKSPEDVKSVLPYWPRVYNKLSVDVDRRVREATQQAMEQLVLRVHRNLAPHLKSLMGHWLVAHNDSYAPAASAARSALQAAFPPTKQIEALVFCKQEIINHISDNLLVQTAATLSDPKCTEPEDMESKYQRILAASLLTWRHFMSIIPIEQQQDLEQLYVRMLQDGKLWKLAKHKTPAVRGAFYSMLATLCQTNPEIANKFGDKVCTTVLHNLDESEPAVSAPLWEAVLYTITAIEGCWNKVNARKAVLPKLWLLLRAGGNGSAGAIYPHLLPLLSRIPSEIIGEGTAFYQEFFGNMQSGLMNERVTVSPSETAAIVGALVECLRFCLHHYLDETEQNKIIQNFFIQDQLLTLLEASFVDSSSSLASSPLYSLMVNLLLSLESSQISGNNDETMTEQRKKLLSIIWGAIHEMCCRHIEMTESDNSQTLQRIGNFLQTFKEPPQKEKKKARVKFMEKTEEELDKSEHSATTSLPLSCPTASSVFPEHSPLMDTVCLTCCTAFARCQDFSSPHHLKYMSQMMKMFVGQRLLTEIYRKKMEQNPGGGPENLPVQVFADVLIPWLTAAPVNSRSLTGSLVDITLAVYGQADSSAKVDMLSKLNQTVGYIMLHLLMDGVIRTTPDIVVQKWFQGKEFGERMLVMTRDLCQACLHESELDTTHVNEAMWALLTLALSPLDNLDSVLSSEWMDRVLLEIRQSLPRPTLQAQLSHGEADRCVTFVCDVAHAFYANVKSCLMLHSAEDLLLALFELSCQHNSPLSETTQNKVTATWQLGLQALLQYKGGLLNEEGFIHKATQHLRLCVLNSADTMDRMQRLCTMTEDLLCVIANGLPTEPGKVNPTISAMQQMLYFRFMHPLITQWSSSVVVKGHLTFSTLPIPAGKTPDVVIPKCVGPVVYTSHLMASQCVIPKLSNTELPSPYEHDLDLLLEVTHGAAFCRAVLGDRKQGLQSSELGRCCKHLEGNLYKLLASLTEKERSDIVILAIDRSYKEGRLWALTLEVILTYSRQQYWDISIGDHLVALDRLSCLDEASLHTLQVALSALQKPELGTIVEVLTAQILSCPQEGITSIAGACGFITLLASAISLQEDPLGDGLEGGSFINPDLINSVLASIQEWREIQDGLFAFDSIVSDLSWSVVCLNTAIMELLHVIVNRLPTHLHNHWDFILCSCVSWIQTCNESRTALNDDLATQTMTSHACELLRCIAMCMRTIVPMQPDAFPGSLLTEWHEFFSEGAYSLVLPLFCEVTGKIALSHPSSAQDVLLRRLGAAIALCPPSHIHSHKLPARLVVDQDTALPDHLQTAMNHLCPLLLAPNRATQLGSYKLLQSLIVELPTYDLEQESPVDKEQVTRSPPAALLAVLETCGLQMDTIMTDIRVGEPIIVEPNTEEHMYTMAYLLSWKLVLAFFRASPSELRAEYAAFLRERSLIDHLVAHLFRIMPESPVISLKDSLSSQSPSQKLSATKNLFSEQPLLDVTGMSTSLEVKHLACAVFYSSLRDLPAAVRQWWNAQDKRTAGFVDNFTTKYVSPVLCTQELASIQEQGIDTENMMVKVRPAAREVLATYTVQEFSMELMVTLASNHPLGTITVESGKRIGVANNQWRNWMLQMTTFLTHQNGSILEGLRLWKRNVDKRFEGVDDCLICFSVIHGTNYTLPKLQCRTCKKRFHSACLYKWFSTSNNNTCPMCRSLF